MTAAAVEAQRAEARRWLVKADEDVDIAHAALALDPPRTGGAAYHVQQAAEKLMKARLTMAAVPFRRTHSLNELAVQIVAFDPALAAVLDPLRPLTTWNFAYRYPSVDELSEAEPAVAEVETGLLMVAALRSAVVEALDTPPG